VKARLLVHRKRIYDDGAVLEMKLWEVPAPVPGSGHALKYSLFYGRGGVRLVGYDNERGKGDHRHYGTFEEPYTWRGPYQLVEDFLEDVRKHRGGKI
jgi:Family of unknown function (DUF6516)